MVIVLKNDATDGQKQVIKNTLKEKSFKINEIKGEESTILAAVGKLAMDVREVEVLPGVAKVIPISKPYKMASREFKPENTIVEIPETAPPRIFRDKTPILYPIIVDGWIFFIKLSIFLFIWIIPLSTNFLMFFS